MFAEVVFGWFSGGWWLGVGFVVEVCLLAEVIVFVLSFWVIEGRFRGQVCGTLDCVLWLEF